MSAELRAELESGPTWTYRWPLRDGTTTPVHADFLPRLGEAVSGLIEQPAREVLAAAGNGSAALDIACNEGFFTHRLLGWGASRAVGIDSREFNIKRAVMIRDHYGIESQRLDFAVRDLFDLDPAADGTFDVVAFLGILYHLEDPVGAMRLVRSLTRRLCLIQTQVMRDQGPALATYADGDRHQLEAAFCLYREPDEVTGLSPLAAMPGKASLIPNSAAVAETALAAGFASCEIVTPPDEDGLWRDWVVALARC